MPRRASFGLADGAAPGRRCLAMSRRAASGMANDELHGAAAGDRQQARCEDGVAVTDLDVVFSCRDFDAFERRLAAESTVDEKAAATSLDREIELAAVFGTPPGAVFGGARRPELPSCAIVAAHDAKGTVVVAGRGPRGIRTREHEPEGRYPDESGQPAFPELRRRVGPAHLLSAYHRRPRTQAEMLPRARDPVIVRA